jgi:hypothetical protein
MTATCETCRFWERAEPGRDHGDCYRYPPQENDAAVLAACWCGEHQPRAAAPAPEAEADALRAALERLTKAADVACVVYGNMPSDGSGDPKYFALADAIGRARVALAATPPRPAMAPETRRVLEEAAGALEGLGIGYMTTRAAAIRTHIAAHGGGND